MESTWKIEHLKKKVIKLDNFKILGCGDLQGHVMTLKVQKMNSEWKINQNKSLIPYEHFENHGSMEI